MRVIQGALRTTAMNRSNVLSATAVGFAILPPPLRPHYAVIANVRQKSLDVSPFFDDSIAIHNFHSIDLCRRICRYVRVDHPSHRFGWRTGALGASFDCMRWLGCRVPLDRKAAKLRLDIRGIRYGYGYMAVVSVLLDYLDRREYHL